MTAEQSRAADDLAAMTEALRLYEDPELSASLAKIADPKPSPCSPWCDVWRHDVDERKWRTCTHRRRK